MSRWRKLLTGVAALALAVGVVTLPVAPTDAYADVEASTQHAKGADGKDCSVTNPLVGGAADQSRSGQRKE